MEELTACRICLATDAKLFNFDQYHLIGMYELLSGSQYLPADHLPHQICSVCIRLLLKCTDLQHRCCTSYSLLNQLIIQQPITTKYLSSIDKSLYHLNLPYTIQNNIISINNDVNDDYIKGENIYHYIEVDEFTVKKESDFKLNDDFFNQINDTQSDIYDTFNDTFDTPDNNFSSDEEPLSKIVKKKHSVKKECENVKTKIDNRFRKKKRKHIHEKYVKKSLKWKEKLSNPINDTIYDSNEKEINKVYKNKKVRIYNAEDLKYLIDHDIDIIYLSKDEQKQQIDSRKTSNNYVMSQYKCNLCHKGFMTDVTYENHMIIHDTSRGTHICDICKSAFSSPRNLASHIANSHSRNFVCRKCNGVFKSCHKAKEHIKWHQGVTFDCSHCDASFRKRTTYMTHVRIRHQSGVACDLCGECFSGPYGLNMHVKKSHRGVQSSKSLTSCDHCHMIFKTVEALNKHKEVADGGVCDVNMVHCQLCGERFESQALLELHMVGHKVDKKYHCDQCNKTYSTAASFSIHRQRVHTHSDHRPSFGASGGQLFVCEHCGIRCANKHTLVNHIRRHTGEKPYPCTLCDKRFTLAQRLQIHVRTHTGERPFKCMVCPKGFTHKAGLNRHMAVHTGAKPYSCNHCQKCFSQSNSLKIHIRTVHLKLPAPYRRSTKKEFTLEPNTVGEGS